MADIQSGIQGLLATLQPSQNYTNDETLQNQQIQQNSLSLNQQKSAVAAAVLANKQKQDLLTAIQNGDPKSYDYKKNIYTLSMLDPSEHDSVKNTLDSMSADAKSQQIQDVSGFRGFIQAGQYDKALALHKSVLDADTKAGNDTTLDQQIYNLTEQAAKGDANAQKQLAALTEANYINTIGPEQYSKLELLPSQEAQNEAAANKDNASARETDVQASVVDPSTANKNNAEAGKAIYDSQPTYDKTTNMSGEAVAYNTKNPNDIVNLDHRDEAIRDANSADAALSSFMGSEFNPNGPANQANPNSTAVGPSQAVDGTWLQTLGQTHPEMFKGMSQAQIDKVTTDPKSMKAFKQTPLGKSILAQKTNVPLANEAASDINKNNLFALSQKGLPLTYRTAAMAYKLGSDAAAKVIQAPDNMPLKNIISDAAIKANPELANMNVGQYEEYIGSQVKGDPDTRIAFDDPNMTGQALLASLPTNIKAQIGKILSGDEQPPSQRGDISSRGTYIEGLLARVDPKYSTKRYALKQQLYDAETKVGAQRQSLNNIVGHLSEFTHAVVNRNAGSGIVGNFIGNVSAKTFNNSGPTANSVGDMKRTIERIASESDQLFGENNMVAKKAGVESLDINGDKTNQLHAAKNVADLAMTKLQNMMDDFSQATGMPANINDFISPSNLAKLQHIQQMAAQATAQPTRGDIEALYAKGNEVVPNTNLTYKDYFDRQYGAGMANKYLSYRGGR